MAGGAEVTADEVGGGNHGVGGVVVAGDVDGAEGVDRRGQGRVDEEEEGHQDVMHGCGGLGVRR